MKKPKVIVVIPAYNSEKTLAKVYRKIPKKNITEVVIADDGSKDHTVRLIKELGLKPIVHKHNLGYGGNQKTLYKTALAKKADYIIMLHPDGQYDPEDLPKFITALMKKQADLILGSRFLTKAINQTPFYKSLSIKLITLLFNIILNENISEVNTGYRGYSARFLKNIPFYKNGNGYIFDPQLIIQAAYFGFKISSIPVSKRYNDGAISPNFPKSLHHGLENLQLLGEYILHRLRIRQADFLTA